MTRVSLGSAVALAVLLTACEGCGSHAAKKSVAHVSPKTRLDAIRRAQVWEATDIPAMDLKTGPTGHGAFPPGAAINCKYVKKDVAGNSPKFTCVIPPDDEVKVKYGRDNGEVYAEVAATRLFWALGFPVDRMYPVSVLCEGCPPGAESTRANGTPALIFDPASVERKFKGRALETAPDSGWSWADLDQVDEAAGGAPRAQRDALKLLAVFVQHTDNKPAQQRLVCVDDKAEEKAEKKTEKADEHGACTHPVMLVNDLGQSFGRSNLFNRDAVGSVNLEQWSAARIWSDKSDRAGCIGDLPPSQTGSLNYPRIGEGGRKFLSDLLTQLSDAQLRDLFEVARFSQRKGGASRPATVDEWVDAFKKKRGEIASRTCPS
jgi:hypothetical protein